MPKLTQKAFTIIELVLVIGIIGVLAGITALIIDPVTQRDTAEDATRYSTIEKLVVAIEGYYAAEGMYPPTVITSDGDPTFLQYVNQWPTPTASGQDYLYWVSPDGQSFGVVIEMAEFATSPSGEQYVYKYHPSYTTIQKCTNPDVADVGCTDADGGGMPACEAASCSTSCIGSGTYIIDGICVEDSCRCIECTRDDDCYYKCVGEYNGYCTSEGMCHCYD